MDGTEGQINSVKSVTAIRVYDYLQHDSKSQVTHINLCSLSENY